METGFLLFMGVPILALLAGNLRFDVAPPPTVNVPIDVGPSPAAFTGLAVGVIAVLCGLVIAVIVVAFLVIRAIKKNQADKERPRAE